MEMQFQRFLVKPDCVYPVGGLQTVALNLKSFIQSFLYVFFSILLERRVVNGNISHMQRIQFCFHFISSVLLFFYFKLFCIGLQPINNVVVVSGEQQRDSAICIHSPPKPFSDPGWHITLSRSPCAIQQVFVGYPFNQCVHDFPKDPNYPFPLATVSLFSVFCEFICIISFQILHIQDVIGYFSFSKCCITE